MSGSWKYQWFNMLVFTQKFCSSRVISLAGKCDTEMSWLTGAACDIKIWWGPFNWSPWFSSKVHLFGRAPASFSPVIAAVPPPSPRLPQCHISIPKCQGDVIELALLSMDYLFNSFSEEQGNISPFGVIDVDCLMVPFIKWLKLSSPLKNT